MDPIFRWRRRITRLGKRVNVHGPTTTVQGHCALVTDTPTPVDRRDLAEHDNPATRAPVLQAIEEPTRTSRTSTKLRDEYEVY
jgi:hypothetical protein